MARGRGVLLVLEDPNPILDEGNPMTGGSITAAAVLCDLMGIELVLDPAPFNYKRGWGHNGLGASKVVCSWTLTIEDVNGLPVSFRFDLCDDDSPLSIGLNVKAESITNLIDNPPTMTIQRKGDKGRRVLPIYMDPLDSSTQTKERATLMKRRVRLDVTGFNITSKGLMSTGTIERARNLRPSTFARRLHRFTHAPVDETKTILRRAGLLTEELERAVEAVAENCDVCARSGQPLPSRKASLNHADEAFNRHLQADYVFVDIKGTKHCVLHAVDAGTSFSEAVIVENRTNDLMASTLERIWLLRHGAPSEFSSDAEFDKAPMRRFLASHSIERKSRPVRRHNKTGIVERKNRTLKGVLERLQHDDTEASPELILDRAVFFSNIFAGSKLLSSFQLARGFAPSFLGMPSTVVSPTVFEAAKQQTAARALTRLLHSRAPSTVPPSCLRPGTLVWFYYKSTKNNEKDEWRPGSIIYAAPHLAAVKTPSGRRSHVAYEDLRLRPTSTLAQELMADTVEHAIGGGRQQQRHSRPHSGLHGYRTALRRHASKSHGRRQPGRRLARSRDHRYATGRTAG